ncbi:MAG: DUF983 domain-containing protein [Proteobacteria bacterium]|nr:DUF983 domain-containing protein [Pseudomonadota bacterium]
MSDRFTATGVDPVSAGLRGRCPACGEGALFKGFIALPEKCSNCGLSYKFADSGDGPAVFVILLAGFLMIGLMFFVEQAYAPPLWLHLVIFIPLTLIVCLGMLRPLKGILIALQYRNKAELGRLEE